MQKKRKDISSDTQNSELESVNASNDAEGEIEELLDQLSETEDDDGVYRLNTLSFEADAERKPTPKKPKSRLGMVKKQQIMLIAFAVLTVTLALMYFLVFKKDYDDAFKRYDEFVTSAGSKYFTDLVKDAGFKTPFEQGALKDIIENVK